MSESLDLLVFGAHPDDAEIGMGGTISIHTSRGLKVGICDLTRAEMSSNGTVELRQQEAEEASRILGLSRRTNLNLPDRGLLLSTEQIDLLVKEIRSTRPRVVAAPYWVDRHPDHTMCSRMVKEAVFNAKLRNYLPDYPAWNVTDVYYYMINDIENPDVMVDVTDVYEQKRSALKAYRSQFFTAAAGSSVATPLNQGYLERIEARDQVFGLKKMMKYAEGFISELPIRLDGL